MPLIGSKPPPKVKKASWGRSGKDVRLIMVEPDDAHAVYVIEEEPGIRRILYDERSYKVWLPWIYFFVRVSKGGQLSTRAPAYILIANARQETLTESDLRIPYLPNLFSHGGICTNHQLTFRSTTPLQSARRFISWFWSSFGNSFFGKKGPKELGTGSAALIRWQSMTPEQAMGIKWRRPKFQSVYMAARCLRFKYWSEWGDNLVEDDMVAMTRIMRKDRR